MFLKSRIVLLISIPLLYALYLLLQLSHFAGQAVRLPRANPTLFVLALSAFAMWVKCHKWSKIKMTLFQTDEKIRKNFFWIFDPSFMVYFFSAESNDTLYLGHKNVIICMGLGLRIYKEMSKYLKPHWRFFLWWIFFIGSHYIEID